MEGKCRPGDVVKGLRHGDSFVIKEEVAQGSGWEVYRVTALQTGFIYLLKLSDNFIMLRDEYDKLSLLNSLPQVCSAKVIPVVFSSDLCRIGQKEYGFYIINNCDGLPLNNYLGKLKDYEILYIFNEINKFLDIMNKAGFTFTGLRPDNIVFNRQTQKIYIIDFSGILPVNKDNPVDFSCNRNTWIFAGRDLKKGVELCYQDHRQNPLKGLGNSNGIAPAREAGRGLVQNSRWDLNKGVYAIGICSLIMFLSSVFYYYF